MQCVRNAGISKWVDHYRNQTLAHLLPSINRFGKYIISDQEPLGFEPVKYMVTRLVVHRLSHSAIEVTTILYSTKRKCNWRLCVNVCYGCKVLWFDPTPMEFDENLYMDVVWRPESEFGVHFSGRRLWRELWTSKNFSIAYISYFEVIYFILSLYNL